MDKKLFQEECLTKGIPEEMMRLIDLIDGKKETALSDAIFNSVELDQFIKSITLPQIEVLDKKSALLEEAKSKSITKKKIK